MTRRLSTPPTADRTPARATDRPGRRSRRAAPDEGGASTELVVATPLILIMLLVVVQLAVWGWAQQVAAAAARRGVDAARLADADTQDGPTAARLITSQIGGSVLTNPQITLTQTSAPLLTVTVTGTAMRYLPGVAFHVTARASATREIYTP